MHEIALPPHEAEPSVAMTGATREWLADDYVLSIRAGRAGEDVLYNRPNQFRLDLQSKILGEYGNLEWLTAQFEVNSNDADQTSLQLFKVQRGLSRAFQLWSRMRCPSYNHYRDRRRNVALPFNPQAEIESQLVKKLGNYSTTHEGLQVKMDPEQLAESTRRVNHIGLYTNKKVFEDSKLWQEDGLLRPGRRLGHLVRLSALQKEWLRLSIDYTLYSANLNGGLEEVTFINPASQISTYKPFTSSA